MILFKKAIRSMMDNKKAYIACIILVMIGILIYCSMGISSYKLDMSKSVYYKENRMADIFVTAKAIPKPLENVLKQVDGIADVSLGLKQDVRVIMPDNDKIITMRLSSINIYDDNPINKVSISGNGFYWANDIVVSESFLKIHNLEIGDTLTLVINTKELKFTICGTGSSPEYVYIIKDAVEILPDDETFSVSFMSENSMSTLFDKKDTYTDATFILEDGYSFSDVKTDLEDILSPYGLTSLIEKKDQMSYSILDAEIKGNLSMARSIPMVFVAIAMAILYLMIKRVIEQDRMQIGTLKAFGYSNFSILFHYMFYGLITGVIGGTLGVISGYMLSGNIMDMYIEFFHLPPIDTNVATGFIIQGLLISVLGGVIGAFMGARRIVKLIPSDAMRAVAPVAIKNDGVKYVPFLKYMLDTSGTMAIRNMMRSKVRSCIIILGIMFSFGIMAFMGSYTSMIDDMLMNQFIKIQLYDAKINFNIPIKNTLATKSIMEIDGVTLSEPLLEIPVELQNKHLKKGIVLTGIQKNSMLYKIYDNEKNINISPSEEGLIVSSSLADKLEVKPGDMLNLTSPLIKDGTKIIVIGIVTQNMGTSCYIEINALTKIFNLGDTATSVILKTDSIAQLKQQVKQADNVKSIDDTSKILKQYKDFLAPYTSLIYIMQTMAIIVAFTIIYNTATISLSERKREFATLRVLGLQVNEVANIMAFEYKILGFLGIISGVPFTIFLKQTIAKSFEMNMFTFPTYTPITAYIQAVVGCIIAIMVSNRSSKKNIKKFDMIEVLKERE